MKRMMQYILVCALCCAWAGTLMAQIAYLHPDIKISTGSKDLSGNYPLGCSNSSMNFSIKLTSDKGKFTIRNEKITFAVGIQPAPGTSSFQSRTSSGPNYFSEYLVQTSLTSQSDFHFFVCYDFDAKWEENTTPDEVVYDEDTAIDGTWKHFHDCQTVVILGQHTLPAMTLSPSALCGNGPFTFCVDGGTASEGATYNFTLPPGLMQVSGGSTNPCIVVQYDPNVPFTGGKLTAKRGTICPPFHFDSQSVILPAAPAPPITVNVSPLRTCSGNCALLVNVNGGQAPFTFTVNSTGATKTISSDTRTCTIANIPCSTATYSGTVTDQYGCTSSWSFTLQSNGSFVREGAYYRETVMPSFSGLPDCKMTLSSGYGSKLAGATIEWYKEPVADPLPAPDKTGNNVNIDEGDYSVKITTSEGCVFWKSVHVPACQGIIMGGDEGISDVYPNPTYDNLLVAVSTFSDKQVTIKVISNATMLPVLNNNMGVQSTGYQVYPVDLSGQPAGNYTLKVQVGSNTPQTRAIVKQ